MSKVTKNYLKAVLMRALRTFFQVLAGALTSAVLLTDVNWFVVLSSAAMSAIFSIVTSFAFTLPEAKDGGRDGSV